MYKKVDIRPLADEEVSQISGGVDCQTEIRVTCDSNGVCKAEAVLVCKF